MDLNSNEIVINDDGLLPLSQTSSSSVSIQKWFNQLEPFIYPLLLWLVVMIMSGVIVLACKHIIGIVSDFGGGFHSWDGKIFISVAKQGYINFNLGNASSSPPTTPFFPLLPLLMRAMHELTAWPYSNCGCIITNAAYLFALIFFYKLLCSKTDQATARRALWLLIMFPTALFFNALYTESLTLLTTVLFFYFLDNNRWYRAMISGFFAAAAHTLGVILVLAALSYLLRLRKQLTFEIFWYRFLSLGIIVSGLLSYMLYLKLHFGNPFIFLLAEKFWHRVETIPLINILQNLQFYTFHHPFGLTPHVLVNVTNGFCALIMVAISVLMILSYRHSTLIPLEVKVYFILTLLVSISSGTQYGSLEAYGRFMVVLFPGFMIWADKLRNPTLFLYTLSLMIPLKTLLLALFASGYWVT